MKTRFLIRVGPFDYRGGGGRGRGGAGRGRGVWHLTLAGDFLLFANRKLGYFSTVPESHRNVFFCLFVFFF